MVMKHAKKLGESIDYEDELRSPGAMQIGKARSAKGVRVYDADFRKLVKAADPWAASRAIAWRLRSNRAPRRRWSPAAKRFRSRAIRRHGSRGPARLWFRDSSLLPRAANLNSLAANRQHAAIVAAKRVGVRFPFAVNKDTLAAEAS